MAYFKMNDIDFSKYVNRIKVSKNTNYVAQTNAAGDTVVDYINQKRTIEVGIISIDSEAMISLQNIIDNLNVSISYREPKTGVLVENVNCIIPTNQVEYYTIRVDEVRFNAFTLTFTEL